MKTVLKTVGRVLMFTPAFVLGLSLAAPAPTNAAALTSCTSADVNVASGPNVGANCAAPAAAATNLFGPGGIFITITNILLFIIGAIAVVMLIIGGIRYVVSSGDQNAVTSAKNTILYAIIGIIVAFLAYAAVNFVTQQLGKST